MRTILYVDDEHINRFLFARNFQKYFNVLLADSGENGLNIYTNTNIDAVVSDMKMPGMNGIEFVRKIKELDTNMPCFILTGYDITLEINTAIKTKILEGYFQKPLNVQIIKETISSAIQKD